MPRHFHEELDALKQTLLAMGGLVEDQIRRVMRALIDRDGDLAQEVIERLDAFVSRDTELARRVCGEDADVDALKEQVFRELLTFMMEDPRTIPRAIRLILISRFLERVADHATNIAEMVIYMVESKMVRHTLA